MDDKKSIFLIALEGHKEHMRQFTEAEGDEPDDSPPDIGVPVDSSDDMDEPTDEGPPDIGSESDDEFTDDSFSSDDTMANDSETGDEEEADMPVSEKISTAMNANLYNKFLDLTDAISNQLSVIDSNTDAITSHAPEALELIASYKKLQENIQSYLGNFFMGINYSKNLLFFNKCINLLNMLNNIFAKKIKSSAE